jgi:hypothetical protein
MKKEKKDIIYSKIEYSKKQKMLSNHEKYKTQIEIVDKMINNEKITSNEFNIFTKLLEYSFKKELKTII